MLFPLKTVITVHFIYTYKLYPSVTILNDNKEKTYKVYPCHQGINIANMKSNKNWNPSVTNKKLKLFVLICNISIFLNQIFCNICPSVTAKGDELVHSCCFIPNLAVLVHRVCVGTWNVGGSLPPDDLDIKDWLDMEDPADIYVLG